jgi:aminoglycoside phosphotransferase (APT) family kinase protein
MAEPWKPEIEVTPALASQLIAVQFPELAGQAVRPFGEGWDNRAFLVGEDLVFRFPQRSFASRFMDNEIRVLPLLAPHLSLPIPHPIYLGQPAGTYPFAFAGYRLIKGTTASHVPLTDSQRSGNATRLGGFLRELHNVPVPEEVTAWVPRDEIGRTDLLRRLSVLEDRLEQIRPRVGFNLDPILSLAKDLASTPAYWGLPRWIHGDLYPRHILIDRDGRLCGVIDWGDTHLGDPALDLSIAFTFLPAAAHRSFQEAYGLIDGATWRRAHFRAVFYGVVLTHYGMSIQDEPMREMGETILRAQIP